MILFSRIFLTSLKIKGSRSAFIGHYFYLNAFNLGLSGTIGFIFANIFFVANIDLLMSNTTTKVNESMGGGYPFYKFECFTI